MKHTGIGAFVHPMVTLGLVAALSGGAVGLGTVWLRHQIAVTANHNEKLRKSISELERQVANVNSDIETEQGPESLRKRNLSMNLNLVLPDEQTQVDRMVENPATLLASKRNRELFGDSAEFARFALDDRR